MFIVFFVLLRTYVHCIEMHILFNNSKSSLQQKSTLYFTKQKIYFKKGPKLEFYETIFLLKNNVPFMELVLRFLQKY